MCASTWIVVYGADLIDEGRGLGPESRARCEAAAKVYWSEVSRGHKVEIFMSPGIMPNYVNQTQPMSWLMRDYLVNLGVSVDDVSANCHRARNSAAETLVAASCFIGDRLIVVSSWHHILRLMWTWRMYGRGFYPHRFVATRRGRFDPLGLIREIFAIAGLLTGLRGPLWCENQSQITIST